MIRVPGIPRKPHVRARAPNSESRTPGPEPRVPNHNPTTTKTRQHGIALILVLWACALLTIMLGGFAVLARTEGTQARYQFGQVQARYAAEAGLARAVAALKDPDRQRRWRSDGQPYHFTFNHADITVRITSEDGKVDLNTAMPEVLEKLLEAVTGSPRKAHALAAAIVDWRDTDDDTHPDGAEADRYAQEGRDYGPRNGPFASIQELQLVLGMDAGLYARLAPLVTIWSGRNVPDPAYAPTGVLAALPGMDGDAAADYVKRRHQADLSDQLPDLPNGMQVFAGGAGSTHSIVSTARLAGGARAVLRATIRQRGNRSNGLPYVVLQWREGSTQ